VCGELYFYKIEGKLFLQRFVMNLRSLFYRNDKVNFM